MMSLLLGNERAGCALVQLQPPRSHDLGCDAPVGPRWDGAKEGREMTLALVENCSGAETCPHLEEMAFFIVTGVGVGGWMGEMGGIDK